VTSDDIFLPKEVESARMDDFEREIEEFKRLVVVPFTDNCVFYSAEKLFLLKTRTFSLS